MDKSFSSAIFVLDSKNVKLGGIKSKKKVAATYASIDSTCPNSCESLKDGSCYAMWGNVGIQTKRLNKKKVSPLEAAKHEKRVILDAIKSNNKSIINRDLRLHVSGDSRTIKGTRIIASAAKAYIKAGGGNVWSYTHAWQKVKRNNWGVVSTLASVDNKSQIKKARKQGYTPAIVVPQFPNENKLFELNGVKFIPCPAQTGDYGCADCRLCMNDQRLFRKNYGIAFEAHGVRKEKMKRRLNVIQ